MAGIIGSFYAGIDTHKDIHVAAVIDHLGQLAGTRYCGTGVEAFIGLWDWLLSYGTIAAIGIEGTGSYGAGVARYLTSQGAVVKEVNRPNRQLRRQRGKNDAVDAEAAARAVLAGHAGAEPKSHDGIVESIRLYRLMLTTFRKERTALISTLRNVVISGPDELRQQHDPLTPGTLFKQCSRLRTTSRPQECPTTVAGITLRTLTTVAGITLRTLTTVAGITLRTLARKILERDLQLNEIRDRLTDLATQANPELMQTKGTGVDSASALLVAVGDNPERLRNEAPFAAFCAVSPIEHPLGRTADTD